MACYKMFGFIKKCFFHRINISIDFNERNLVEHSSTELYFNEQSKMYGMTRNYLSKWE